MAQKYISKFQLKPGVWVFVPTIANAAKGNEIKSLLESRWKLPKYFYHLRKGGHVEALKAHLNNNCFIHLDIQNFFGSINRTRVTRCLKDFFSYSVAREYANESTVMHPRERKTILPFGFVQSPILASICLEKSTLGIYLKRLSKNKKIVVSVYVDDIVLSTNDEALFNEITDSLKLAADKARLSLNDEKTEGPSDKITAFNIELSNKIINITDKRIDELKVAYLSADSEHQQKGILGYIASVNELQKNAILEALD